MSRGFFANTELDHANGGYRGTVIHFGGRFKTIEQEWDDWLAKYEGLLRQLYWETSVVFLDTELSGEYKFKWWQESWEGLLTTPPSLPISWNFDGPFRRWE